tara:strand:+ start:241 stop:483 length:243 start_codon:yes stop_codon:yes gene_type:complete
MTYKTWETFLDQMNKSKDTVVLDLTKKGENKQKENLVNKFDTLFYSIENIDTQNKYLRDVLRLIPDEILKGLIKKMGDKS